MSTSASSAAAVADELGRLLAEPAILSAPQLADSTALATSATGIALLHIERAHAGTGDWTTAHAWVTAASHHEIHTLDDRGLYTGAAALAFTLHAADTDDAGRYTAVTRALDSIVTATTHRRITAAHARIDRGEPASFGEYDLFSGMTGLGAYLLRYAPGTDALEDVLTYLVRLTQPLPGAGALPGWWVDHDPQLRTSPQFRGGHANLGIAHGITGPLALLAHAHGRGMTVDGHAEAIDTITSWFDRWRQHTDSGPFWPQWITRDELAAGIPHQRDPGRPSWCYGTPGIARAQQLTAIATQSTARQDMAEDALDACLTDATQLGHIIDTSLCHGWAGLYHTVWRAARDARSARLIRHLPHLAEQLVTHSQTRRGDATGFLEGDAGLALALHTAATGTPPASSWDSALLLT